MKKWFATSVVVLGLTASGFAISKGGFHHASEPHGASHFKMKQYILAEVLDLSEEQKEKIAAIHRELREERLTRKEAHSGESPRQALFNLSPEDPGFEEKVAEIARKKASMVEQRVIQHAHRYARMYEVLNVEQREKFKELMANMGPRMKMKFHH